MSLFYCINGPLLDKYVVQDLFFKVFLFLWKRIPLCVIQYGIQSKYIWQKSD